MIRRLHWLSLILAVVVIPSLPAQQPKDASAPIPALILSAKKVFITNGGSDVMSWSAFQHAGTPNEPYNAFCLAMKDWGHYNLVSDPSNADLIFEISFGAPLVDADKLPTYAPHLRLTIVDAKTHFNLWSILAPVGGAYRKVTFEKNYATGLASLMTQLKKLTATTQAVDGAGK